MSNDSVSTKLQELFDLYKSGALSNEEYDLLKSELIGKEKAAESNPDKQGIKKNLEHDIQESKEEELSENKESEPVKAETTVSKGEVVEKHEQQGIDITEPVKEKKRNKVWLIAISIMLSVLAIFLIFKFSHTTSIISGEEEHILKDIDGNVYQTIQIGTQVWMAENLRTTKFNDGTSIPLVKEDASWGSVSTPAYCWYKNDTTNKTTKGALYNWHTINNNKLCPEGWHVPSDSEWLLLTDYLSNNGYGYQGDGNNISKSLASKTGWNYSNDLGSVGNDQLSNNKTGFNSYPSGIRFSNGEFRHSGQNAKFWSSTETSEKSAQIRFISWNDGIVSSYSNGKQNGFSVRCVRDIESQQNQLTQQNYTETKETPEKTLSSESIQTFDTTAATELIMQDLSENPSEWQNDLGEYVKEMTHEVLSFNEIDLGSKKLKIFIMKSEWEGGCPPYCAGIVSSYEFIIENNKWIINRKAKGFTYFRDEGEISFYLLTPTEYGIKTIHNYTGGKFGGMKVELFAYDKKNLIQTLSSYSEESIELKAKVYSGVSYLQLDITEENTKSTTYYKFNGTIYEEFDGAVTDPALTDMSRFIDINKINKENSHNQSKQSEDNNEFIREFLTSHTFVNHEVGGSFYLKFSSKSGGWGGSMTMSMGSCDAVYSYILDGIDINLTYVGSNCESITGSSQTMTFNYDKSISVIIKGQKFVFKPM